MESQQFHTLEISKIEPETSSAVCITFHVPDRLQATFRFIQGQFITLRCMVNNQELRRSYSICSAVNENNLRIAIKRVENGAFSNHANNHFRVGDTIDVMPPQGGFYTELDISNKKNYMCIAVGSGITPILSIVKSILVSEPESHITLLYGNRRSNTIMFKNELLQIKNRYMSRFNWINILSREDQYSELLGGIINNKKGFALHKSGLISINTTDNVFICGPESMMSEVSRGFRASGLDQSCINYELFASSIKDSEKIIEKTQERIDTYGEDLICKVTLIADGRSIDFQLPATGENILDSGIHHGLDLPHSCKAGVCSTCKARLIEGQVDMDITHGLEQHEIDAGYILSCQAHPISAEVKIDFDQRF
jgi:ring-1,2-phenylacetyl-CoA epoxidase subunit PaaE